MLLSVILLLLLIGGCCAVGRLLLLSVYLLLLPREPLLHEIGRNSREAPPPTIKTGGDVALFEGGTESVVKLLLHFLCCH